jgi:ankyrin repeat protein
VIALSKLSVCRVQKADLSALDNLGHTPLDDALRMDQLAVAYLLLEAGAVTGDAENSADQENGWERLRTRMDLNVPEIQHQVANKKWDVETSPDLYVFMDNACREIDFFTKLTHDEVSSRLHSAPKI